VRIAAVQHDIVWEDKDANFERLAPMVAAAAGADARLVLVSETFSTGFSSDPRIREHEGGPSSQFLMDMARQHDVWVGGTCAEVPAGNDLATTRAFNTFVLAAPDGTTHRYRKIHPFTYGREHESFDAGSTFTQVEIDGLRVAMFVCYDLRFADEFWQLAPTTDVYLVPANWPEARRQHWMSLLQARAIENQAYVVGCNRVGRSKAVEGDGAAALNYVGDSRIVDPLGEMLATASVGESILLADVTAERVSEVRSRFPFQQDRR
jgi:predicted amidohydrolase